MDARRIWICACPDGRRVTDERLTRQVHYPRAEAPTASMHHVASKYKCVIPLDKLAIKLENVDRFIEYLQPSGQFKKAFRNQKGDSILLQKI